MVDKAKRLQLAGHMAWIGTYDMNNQPWRTVLKLDLM
jgi:hypothetical protein